MSQIIKYLLILMLLFTSIGFSQETGKIKGKVFESGSGDPLIGANIMIDGTSIGTASNLDGEFVLSSVEPGNYNLKISYVGYKQKTEKVTVVSNRATEVIIELEWIAVEGKEVLVTAQAKGQLSAINEQLSADEIKNVVSKDKIRELPDQNAAESVGRLPGVSLLRSGGEGNKVVIRGMEPKYNKIMVDGVTLAPTSESDRSVSMGMISSYSLEGIEVIKSPTANMDGDQVGGSVNFVMRTAPENFNYEVVAQGGYNGLRKSAGDYLFVGGVSNRFLKNKLGLFAQFTTDKKDMSSNIMSANYQLLSNTEDVIDPLGITGVNLKNSFRERIRYGGTFTIDYLIPEGKIYLKNFINSGQSKTQAYNESYSESGHNFTTSDATFNQLIYSNVLSYEQNISFFNIKAKLSHSFSSGDTPNNIIFRFEGATDMNNFPTDVSPEEIPDYAKNNYNQIIWGRVYDNTSYKEGRQIMASLDLETDFSISNQINGKIKFGGKFRYDERMYDYNSFYGHPSVASGIDYKNELLNNIDAFGNLPVGTSTFMYPLFYDNNFSHGEFLNNRYTLGPVSDTKLMHEIVDVLNNTYAEKRAADPNTYDEVYSYRARSSTLYDYSGIERLGAGYLMADINLTKDIKFLPGIRYEAKQTEYSGVYGRSGGKPEAKYNTTDTTSIRNNDFFLPMIHLKYEPLDWLQVRLAYTHTIARPNFNYILPNRDITTEDEIIMKNPNLRPELSKNIDVYFSFTENHLGLFSIGGFYKEIEDKIFYRGSRILLNPEEYGLDSIYTGYTFRTHENNSNKSTVKGIEIDWQTNFWYLPSFLKGIVLNVNYTKIYSQTKYPKDEIETIINPNYPGPNEPRRIQVNVDKSYWDRLQNQPNDIVNLGIGYDYKGFSARLSMNYSSDIFISSSFYEETRSLTDDFLRWDLSITQKLPWQGLQLYCNVVNLNNEDKTNYYYGGNQKNAATHYGRAIYFGIRWRSDN